MYKTKSFHITVDHPSHTFTLQLPTSFQVLGVDRNFVGLDVLYDERAPVEPTKFFVAVENEEVPVEIVRFKEYLGSVTVHGIVRSGGMVPGRRYHIFGPRAGGAFTVNPNLRF